MALLAAGYAIASQATNREAAAQDLTRAVGLLAGLHQQIIRRGAGVAAATLAMAAVIGSTQGLPDVANHVERDIRENAARAANCSALIEAFRAAVALLRRGLANRTATPDRVIRDRQDALEAAIAALYRCMRLPVPSFAPRR